VKGKELNMKQMKAEELGMPVLWTTEKDGGASGRLRKHHVRSKSIPSQLEMLERWTEFERRARKQSRRRKLQHLACGCCVKGLVD